MAGVSPVSPKFQFLSSTGVPMVGGTVTVYLAGTTTPSNTWQDRSQSTLNTNPITLDSRGEATIWLDSSLTYKFLVKNAAGVEQYTADNISGASTLGTVVTFIQAGTGAVTRTAQDKMRDIVHIKDFGAAADGTTDDTAAILAAIASLPNGGTVLLGRGTIIASQIAITTSGIHLRGEGVNVTTLKLKSASNSFFVTFTGVDGGSFSQATIDGNLAGNAAITDKVALFGNQCSNVTFHDFHVKDYDDKGVGFDGGPVGSETTNNTISRFSVTNCNGQAVIIDGSSGTNTGAVISDFHIYETGHAGVAVNDGASDVTISNGIADLNNIIWDAISCRNVKRVKVSNVIGKRGRYGLSALYDTAPCEDISAVNCHFRENAQHGVLLISAKRTTLVSVTSANNVSSGFTITKDAAGAESDDTKLINCSAFDDQGVATQLYGYQVLNATTQTLIAGCSASGNVTGVMNISGTVAWGELLVTKGSGMEINGRHKWVVSAAAGNLVEFWRTTDSQARFAITNSGLLEWGTGSAARDINLGRVGTNLLGTDDKFIAGGGLGVGLSASGLSAQVAIPAGNTSHKLAIYDSANNLIGYIPVYAAAW